MISTKIKGVTLQFKTSPMLFSPSAIDTGTLAMLSVVDFTSTDKVLDLGCGYGVVGILAGRLIGGEKVVMCDILKKAVEYVGINAELNNVSGLDIRLSDGFENIPERDFTIILSNPPYHTDFAVAKGFIENGFKRLQKGGRMVMVTKRLTWYKNKFTAIFGGVKVYGIDGYYVFVAEKRDTYIKKKAKDRNHLSKKLRRKKIKQQYEINNCKA